MTWQPIPVEMPGDPLWRALEPSRPIHPMELALELSVLAGEGNPIRLTEPLRRFMVNCIDFGSGMILGHPVEVVAERGDAA